MCKPPEKKTEKQSIQHDKEKYKAILEKGSFNDQEVILTKTTTNMNNSGEAVVLLKKKFKDARLIVVVDDIDLPKGKLRYRENGKSGTHNGMRSIVSYIGEDFERVRIGVGRDESKDLADYVLSNIKLEDEELFNSAIKNAGDMILEKIK